MVNCLDVEPMSYKNNRVVLNKNQSIDKEQKVIRIKVRLGKNALSWSKIIFVHMKGYSCIFVYATGLSIHSFKKKKWNKFSKDLISWHSHQIFNFLKWWVTVFRTNDNPKKKNQGLEKFVAINGRSVWMSWKERKLTYKQQPYLWIEILKL